MKRKGWINKFLSSEFWLWMLLCVCLDSWMHSDGYTQCDYQPEWLWLLHAGTHLWPTVVWHLHSGQKKQNRRRKYQSVSSVYVWFFLPISTAKNHSAQQNRTIKWAAGLEKLRTGKKSLHLSVLWVGGPFCDCRYSVIIYFWLVNGNFQSISILDSVWV